MGILRGGAALKIVADDIEDRSFKPQVMENDFAVNDEIEHDYIDDAEELWIKRRRELIGAINELSPHLIARLKRDYQVSDPDVERMRTKATTECMRAVRACESPIEVRALAAVMFADYEWFPGVPAVHLTDGNEALPSGEIVIIPQFKFARYRMDLALLARVGSARKIICIEADGHEFHKDRYWEDRVRDEYFRSWEIETVRFTGRQIDSDRLRLVGQAVADLITVWREKLPGGIITTAAL